SQHSGGRGRRISEFEASLVYKVSSRTTRGYTEKPCLEKPKKKKETGKSAVGHLWIVGMVEEPGESGGLYWGHSRLLRVLSSCPNLYHCMVIEELGSSPRHMVKFPRFFLHSSGNFHKSQKCSRV
ncbi:mCG1028373, partial [Mus musculus]